MPEAAQTISLASHVSVAIAVALLFGVARFVPHTVTTKRWSIASLSISGIQLMIVILWAVGIVALLPLLEGFSSVATALLFSWPLLLPKPNTRWDPLLITVFIALIVALAAILAVESLGTTSVPQGLWGILGLLVSISVLFALAVRRSDRWPLFFIGYSLLFAGFVVGTWLLAGVLPLLEMIIYPVMTFFVIGGLINSAKLEEPRSQLSEFSKAVSFFKRAVEPATLIYGGLRSITFSLQARYGLIFLRSDPSGVLTLLTSVDAEGIRELSGPPLQGKALPEITTSMAQGQARILHQESELKELREALNLDPTGQAMLSPIHLDGGNLGALLLLADINRPGWSASDLETCEALTAYLGRRIKEGPHFAEDEHSAETEMLRGELRLALQELSEVSAVESPGSMAEVGTLTALLTAMREPVSSIRGYYEILRGSATGELDSEQLGFLDHIRQDATQLDRQLTDLLNLVTAPHEAAQSTVDIGEVVDIAASQVGTDLKQSGIQLMREIPEALPQVRVDPNMLRQVIVILLERAIRITSSGSQIGVAAHADDDGWVSIAVSDQGPGLPAEDLGRAFQSSEGELPQVKALADSLGGRVWIGSEMGAGSTVTVLIPTSEGTVASAS